MTTALNHTTCRACGATDLVSVLSLGLQPLANDFLRETSRSNYPLEVLYCEGCTLGQLSLTLDPMVLYPPTYAYIQSDSQTMLRHFEALSTDIIAAGGRGPVLEIGSNDGAFLTHLRKLGFIDVVGMDPAGSGPEPCVKDLFSVKSAENLKASSGLRSLIVGRHVFAHLDDWRGFVEALDRIAAPRLSHRNRGSLRA